MVELKIESSPKLFRLTILLVMSGLAFLNTTVGAKACRIAHHEVQDETIDATWVIFRGAVVSYQLIDSAYAKVIFKTTETYRGESRKTWEVIWQNSTFGHPKDIGEFRKHFGKDTVVGLRKPEDLGPRRTWKYPWVKQSPCRPPVMVKWRGGNAVFDLFSILVEKGVIPNTKQ